MLVGSTRGRENIILAALLGLSAELETGRAAGEGGDGEGNEG